MKTKKIIAMIISAIMVFSVVPMAVFAAEDTQITTTLPAEAKVGEQVAFDVTTNANTDAGTTVLAKFYVNGPAAADTEYYETGGAASGQWLPLTGDTFGPATGFPLMDGATSKFRTTFNQAGTYTVQIDIVKFDDQTVLASTTETITVSDVVAPTVTIDMDDIFVIGEPTGFAISTTGGDKEGTMVLGTAEFDGTAAIEKIEYLEVKDGNWYELTGDHFGPAGGFPLGDFTSEFRVTFKEAGTFSLTVKIVDAANTNTVLATATKTISSEAMADYSKVDAAIAKAEALNRDAYVDFTEVDNTINAVVRGLGVSNQADVDAMAKAIEDAIAGLQLKETAAGTSYQIIAGANSTWIKGNTNGLTVTSNGDFAKFTAVKVDGAQIAAENYTAVSGSTIVTLNAAYLETLTEGTHTLTLVYTDGEVSTEFTVTPQTAAGTVGNTNGMNSPQTGDNSNTVTWIAVAVVAIGVMTGTVLFARKRKAE